MYRLVLCVPGRPHLHNTTVELIPGVRLTLAALPGCPVACRQLSLSGRELVSVSLPLSVP